MTKGKRNRCNGSIGWAWIFILAVITGCMPLTDTTTTPALKYFPAAEAMSNPSKPLTYGPLELQAAVMAFADTHASMIGGASERLAQKAGDRDARLTAARVRVYGIASAFEIAAGPYPGIGLLDMIVFTSLNRMVWEDYWVPNVFGPAGNDMLTAYRKLEKEIWRIGARLMTPEQVTEFRRLIEQWRRDHPEQTGTNWVRFSDFGKLGLKPSMKPLTQPGGLFASISEATAIARDMKTSVDRAMYLISRMQLVINLQVDLAYAELAAKPEMTQMADKADEAVVLARRYADLIERLPKDVEQMTANVLDQTMAQISRERAAAIAQAIEGIGRLETELVENAMAKISTERQQAIDQAMTGLAERQKDLEKMLSDTIGQGQRQINDALYSTFLIGVAWIGAFFAALFIYRLLARWLIKPSKPA